MAPTTSRLTRQLQLQISASKGFRLWKGDVTGAFLQGRPYPDELFCLPCPEILTSMQDADFSISLSQEKYVDELKYINIRAHRRKEQHAETDECEKSQLRSLLGGISWHAQQVAPHFSAEVGLLLSEIIRSTVETMNSANQLLHQVKNRRSHRLKVHSLPLNNLGLFAWRDAAKQNRCDGSSTAGIVIGASSLNLLQGSVESIFFFVGLALIKD